MLKEDQRAAKILTAMWWDAGWKSSPSLPSDDDWEYGKNAGYLFDPVDADHDQLVARIRGLAANLTLSQGADSFLASLSTRNCFLRPFLSAIVLGTNLPDHTFEPLASRPPGIYSDGSIGDCVVCGEPSGTQTIDLNVLNFERHRWGGVRHLGLASVWFHLDRLRSEGDASPCPADQRLLTAVLGELRQRSGTSITKAVDALKAIPGTKDQRLHIMQVLSIAGVLQHPNHPGFLHGWVPAAERLLPNRRFLDSGYPAEWWDGGVNHEAVSTLFPHV